MACISGIFPGTTNPPHETFVFVTRLRRIEGFECLRGLHHITTTP
jgi:hypothetical protein